MIWLPLWKAYVNVCHIDAHIYKSWTTEKYWNNQEVNQAARIKASQVDLDWQHEVKLFLGWWAHDTSGHQGRDAACTWAHGWEVKSTMDRLIACSTYK